MSKKKNSFSSLGRLVYSTDPDFKIDNTPNEEQETLLPQQQQLRILLDKKQRAGKMVTLITGFVGTTAAMEELGKKIKTFCGSGGSVKDGEIIVQGDNGDKVLQWLQKNGYAAAKKI